MTTLSRKLIADMLAAAAIKLGGPLFRAVGSQPGSFPRYLRQADRSGVHLRSTHYHQPVYAEIDLPADTTGERELPGLDMRASEQLALLESFNFSDGLAQFANVAPMNGEFGHLNLHYAYSDAESLYCMLRTIRPHRFVEIGSGYSTWVAKAALLRNLADGSSAGCRHICIEPYNFHLIDHLDMEIIKKPVQNVDPSFFSILQAGDVLFIDSSHVIRPWGDVLFEYQRIIPRLAKGVLVHVHDIFTPRDYPESWLRGDRRLWNEQYLLEAMLAHSSRYTVRLALNWAKHHHRDAFLRAFPADKYNPQHQPGAFWFEITE